MFPTINGWVRTIAPIERVPIYDHQDPIDLEGTIPAGVVGVVIDQSDDFVTIAFTWGGGEAPRMAVATLPTDDALRQTLTAWQEGDPS